MLDDHHRTVLDRILLVANLHFHQHSDVWSPATRLADVTGWTEPIGFQFMSRLEEEFLIRFRTADYKTVHNIGDLERLVDEHLK